MKYYSIIGEYSQALWSGAFIVMIGLGLASVSETSWVFIAAKIFFAIGIFGATVHLFMEASRSFFGQVKSVSSNGRMQLYSRANIILFVVSVTVVLIGGANLPAFPSMQTNTRLVLYGVGSIVWLTWLAGAIILDRQNRQTANAARADD